MPYKAEERDGHWVVVNEETGDVKDEPGDEESAKRTARLLNELEKKGDDE